MAILHKGEEYGQSRELKAAEVLAFMLVSGVKAVAVAMAADALVIGGRLALLNERVSVGSILLMTGGVGAVSFAAHLLGDLDTLVEGLRSWRAVESYAPPELERQPEKPRTPIMVRPYQGEPYVLTEPDQPALPGREEALQLTPGVVAEVLRASLEEYGGEWSRRKLMALRVMGQNVSRGMYEELTGWLHWAGFLQQTRQGGFTFPPDVEGYDDLRRYFPNLPGGEGWELGGMGTGVAQVTRDGNGGGESLAERRRRKFVELGCERYLEWKVGGEGVSRYAPTNQ